MLLRLLLPMLIHKYACMRLQNVKFNCMECDLQFEHLFYCNEIPHASQATHLNAFHSKLNFHSFDKIVTTFHRIAMRLGVCEYAWWCVHIVCTEVIYIYFTCRAIFAVVSTHKFPPKTPFFKYQNMQNHWNQQQKHELGEKERCNTKMFFELVFCQMSICVFIHPCYSWLSNWHLNCRPIWKCMTKLCVCTHVPPLLFVVHFACVYFVCTNGKLC